MTITPTRRVTVEDIEAPAELEPLAPAPVARLVAELRQRIADLHEADRTVKEAVEPVNLAAATTARATAHAARVAAAQRLKTTVDQHREQWQADLDARREEQTRRCEELLDGLVAELAERNRTDAASWYTTNYYWSAPPGILAFADHPEYPIGQLRNIIRPTTG
jgi:hypothetical protein